MHYNNNLHPLARGYQLFPQLLPSHFTLTECKLIEKIFKRVMDDGFVLWSKNANIDVLMNYIPH